MSFTPWDSARASELARNLERSARIDEVGHTDRYAGSASQDKLGRVLTGHDAADAVDGNVDGFGNLPDHTHGDVMAQRAERPPLGLATRDLRVWTSMAIPWMELMTERPSAPAASRDLAISATLTGAIFTNSGLSVTLRHAAIDSRGALGRGAHQQHAGGDVGAAHVDLIAGSPGAQLNIHLERTDELARNDRQPGR